MREHAPSMREHARGRDLRCGGGERRRATLRSRGKERGKEGKEEASTGGEEGSRARGGRASGTRELALCVCVCMGGGRELARNGCAHLKAEGSRSLMSWPPHRDASGVSENTTYVRKHNFNLELVDIRPPQVFDHLTTNPKRYFRRLAHTHTNCLDATCGGWPGG